MKLRIRSFLVVTALSFQAAGLAHTQPQGTTAPGKIPEVETAPLLLSAVAQTELTIPLWFAGVPDLGPGVRVQLTDSVGKPIAAGGPISVQVPVAETSGPHQGSTTVRVIADGRQVKPQRVRLTLFRPDGTGPYAEIRVPLAAPRPTLTDVEFRNGPDTWSRTLEIPASGQLKTTIRVRSGPFWDGTQVSLPAPYKVSNVRIATSPVGGELTADVTLDPPALPSELKLGNVDLAVGHPIGARETTTVVVQGARGPRFSSLAAVEVSDGAETLRFDIDYLVPGARIEILPPNDGYVFDRFEFFPRVTGPTVTLTENIFPPLPVNSRMVEARVTNPDGRSHTASLQLVRAAPKTLKVTAITPVVAGAPSRILLEPVRPADRFDPRQQRAYVLMVQGTSVPLENPSVDSDGTALRALVRVPVHLVPASVTTERLEVELRGPAPAEILRGNLDVLARPVIDQPYVPIRPGESRVVSLSGRFLSGLQLQGNQQVAVVGTQQWSAVGASVELRARPGASGEQGLEIVRNDVVVDTLTVRVVSWLTPAELRGMVQWRQRGEETWRNFVETEVMEVSPKQPIQIRVAPQVRHVFDEEWIRFAAQKDGTVAWTDSLFVGPGSPKEILDPFIPRTVFQDGDEFALTVSSAGGSTLRQRIRVQYDRSFASLRHVGIVSGVTAIQLPLGGSARREFREGVFDGVVIGLSWPIDAIANRFNGDYVKFTTIITAGNAPSVAPADTTAATAAAEETADSDDDSGIEWGASAGLLFFDTMFMTIGWDTRGDRASQGWNATVGVNLALDALVKLARRR